MLCPVSPHREHLRMLVTLSSEVLVRVVDVGPRDAVLVAAFLAWPRVPVVVEASLPVQVLSAPIAVPVNIGEPFAHCSVTSLMRVSVGDAALPTVVLGLAPRVAVRRAVYFFFAASFLSFASFSMRSAFSRRRFASARSSLGVRFVAPGVRGTACLLGR